MLNDVGAIDLVTHLTRETIEAAVRHEPLPDHDRVRQACRRYPSLCEPSGAFVTVYIKGELRGCLGEILPSDSVLEVILRCAARSPVADYRFDPIRPAELDHLSFRISLLTHPEPIESEEDIVIGRDGLLVRYGRHVGLLLPEVPVEHGWNREAFLHALWRKAGLTHDVPLAATHLMRFQTQLIEIGAPIHHAA